MALANSGSGRGGPVRTVRPNFRGWYSAHRHSILFLSLLLALLLAPMMQEYQLRSGAVESIYLVILAAAAGEPDRTRGRRWAVVTISVTAALRVIGRFWNFEPATAAAAILFVSLCVLAAVASLRFAFQEGHADRERLAAALSTYLLSGQVFGVCYWKIAQLRAGAFAIGGTPIAAGVLDLPTSAYFSFVTLATLGYGDIVPSEPITRGLAVGEAIVGQLYLAVLIASLVGNRRVK